MEGKYTKFVKQSNINMQAKLIYLLQSVGNINGQWDTQHHKQIAA